MKVVDSFPRTVREIENTWITMPDGCRLAARIWLPEDAEEHPVPAILECMPYRKRDFTRLRDEPLHHYLAGHGYASIRLDLRGSGDSDGLILDEYLQQEQDDCLAVLDWITSQPWCSGPVGMFGISWGGFNALQVAAHQPECLKAIITMCSTDDRYADDAHYMGGCLLNENLNWGSVFFATAAFPPDPALYGDDWREQWRYRLENQVLYPAVWMRHQQRDDYWKHGSVCENFDDIQCAVYAVGGWADGYPNAIPRMMEGLSAPRKALIGPWSHAFPHNALPGPAIGFFQEMLRWWDYWLKDIDNGIMDEPPMRVWMEEHVPPAPLYEYRPGRWVAEPAWPSERIQNETLYLNVLSMGRRAEPEDRMRITSPETTGLAGGDWYGFGGEGEMAIDQREDDGKSLVFDADTVLERIEILGAPVAELEVTVDRPVAYVIVRLNDVAPDGASTRVTWGVLNLTQRESREHPEPLEAGKRYRVRVQMKDVAYAFAPGHTMRLAVSTSYWPMIWPSPEPVRLTLHTGVSSLQLPVRPPREEDEQLRPFEPPERGPQAEPEALSSGDFRRTVERNLINNETTYRIYNEGGDFGGASLAYIEDIDLTAGYSLGKWFRIHEYDASGAEARIDQSCVLQRDDWSARVECVTRLTADPQHFRLRATLHAYDGDALFFEREWDERIPRHLI
ncbi:CocE/NonD family hydrolase [Halospina sp. K52047b]|uniref:CocE/NonD family hydrolase n=1 Tax=Halospina sp. K52047b TaxID=2614160 RepID=UPI00124ABBEB|nr:CocE/NonD family hydrolase [Halospina sp. K52047b]KAA8984544.1 CocE/NonD family hydrolase [Halospina sp. K52047b]